MADALERVFGKSKYRVKLRYLRDSTLESPSMALGTGGAIKQAESLLKKENCFFVQNGDILSEINYEEIVQLHKTKGVMATLALHKVKDPSRYGVVKLSSTGFIEDFIEKPKKDAPSNLVNAGIYVFNPEVFKYIPRGKPCSIEREVFPKLARERKLRGYEASNLWIDVGKPVDYIKANRIWIEKVEASRSSITATKSEENWLILQPICIDENVTIGRTSEIGPNASLGKGCQIGQAVKISNSIIFPTVTIGNQTIITGTIIGAGVKIGEKVRIGTGCLIGDKATIRDGVKLANHTKVQPNKEVSNNARRS
ncbi:MAG: NDP-sugar synthase [Candidatus Bathyarchaeota archaeon]|nr:MAG: NDP-sugar synthase [Candidatus Bathyarchaeota archaeon]